MPLATITSTTAWDNQEIDFYIFLETPEKQVIVDEIIYKMECLGLIVNAVYFTDVTEWSIAGVTDLPDATYGGLSYTWFIDDIFNLAYILYLQKMHMLAGTFDDKKFNTLVDKLTDMFLEGTAPDFVMTEKFMKNMIETFQDVEKRLWNKKLMLPFVQWEGFFPPFGMNILFTEIIITNSVQGRVFSNLGLRKALHRSIDRSVFLDYHAIYTPYLVYEVSHLYQMSIHHDTNLPNN